LRLENLEATASGSQREELEAAVDETARLGELVEQLLHLARAQNDPPARVTVDLVPLVDERLSVWSALAGDRGVVLRADVNGAVRALAIPGAVEQVLDNLIDNAVGVSPRGGTVTVQVRPVSSEVELRVSDQGPGLEADAREHAFDRFWRGDRERRGTGLGLAIVKQLVELSGGDVHLDEAPGGGLAAVVHLPGAPS
jgi:signal transduction histidine kinase